MSDNKKLYVLEVTYQAYVWADDEADAEELLPEIIDTENPSVFHVYETDKNILGWHEYNCVYHHGDVDVTIGDILKQMKSDDK